MTLSLLSHDALVVLRVAGSELEEGVERGLRTLFARRYLPSYQLARGVPRGSPGAVVDWLPGPRFNIASISLSDTSEDRYVVESPPPSPYANESPYFFLLQVLSRSYAKRSLVMLTDSVSFLVSEGRAVLVLGYPHGGKSTILSIALSRGYEPLTTENTLVRATSDGLEVVGGSRVLVVDPRSLERYNADLGVEPDEVTRHGYLVYDLDGEGWARPPARVEAIFVVHCSFAAKGASLERVRGRKIPKLLWHFASSIPRGTDYYEPEPPSLASPVVDREISKLVYHAAREYSGRFYEVFGAHDEALDLILKTVE